MSAPVDTFGHTHYKPVGENRVPMDQWGKDHWSTLAYLEVRIVDHKGRIEHDHMRCHMQRHPAMHAAKRRAIAFGNSDGSEYPTRLRDGSLADHDDYDCIDDMIAAGIVTATTPAAPSGTLITGFVEAELMAHATYAMTVLGQEVVKQLRAHKSNGGAWRTFIPDASQLTCLDSHHEAGARRKSRRVRDTQ